MQYMYIVHCTLGFAELKNIYKFKDEKVKKDLDLPPNPLDDIIDRFGVDNVAEMTGRSGRILRKTENTFRYTKRFGGSKTSYGLQMPVSREDESDRLNVKERALFQAGK